jgi:hypothetical protein
VAERLQSAQLRTHALQQTAFLFYDLVGGAAQRQRNGDAERLRSLEVKDQLDLGGLLDRQIGRISTLQNSGSVDAYGGSIADIYRFGLA